jgi:tetratricopeptide (TPR) repeat protein/glycosyltransferase involved in cell wall biosynthesis
MATRSAAPLSSADSAPPLFERAVRLHIAGDRAGAERLYRVCLTANPIHAESMNNLGSIVGDDGRSNDAIELFTRAVSERADYGEAWNNLGITLARVARHADAIGAFQRAVDCESDRALWWNNLGNSLLECFRFDEAFAAYERAVSLDATNPDLWSNRGLALRGQRRPDDAIASLERALAIDPAYVNALTNLGVILKERREFGRALDLMRRALAAAPNDSVVMTNLAATYEAMGDFERMRAIADAGLAIDDQFAEFHVLNGNYWMEAGEYARATECYERAVALDPENRNANWNLAIISLLHGDFERGWKQFEWRRRLQSVLTDHGTYAGEEWDGSPLDGRTILLLAEQGLGDTIQFIRFASELRARGAGRVLVEAPAPVVPLIASAQGVDAVIARGLPLPSYDVHARLMGLPRLLGTEVSTIPAPAAYLTAERRAAASRVTAPAGTLKVGIAWAGNPDHRRDHLRSMSLEALRPLLDVKGVRFYSVQKGGPEAQLAAFAAPNVTDLSPHLADLQDTAAAIDQLDLVITVDTAIAHLAGALGRPVWVMITHVPDFRWMLDRDDTPWYPSMRLFRQPAPRDWTPVIELVTQALRDRVATDAAQRAAEASADMSRPAEPLTAIIAAGRTLQGRRRFELAVPLSELATPSAFAAYQAELVGGGHEAAFRALLDEAMHDGDGFADLSPGLGLTACNAATVAGRRTRVRLVGPELSNAAHRVAAATGNSDVQAPASLADALATGDTTGAWFVRVGNASDAEAAIDAVLSIDAPHQIAAVLWPRDVSVLCSSALATLAQHGFINCAVTVEAGEVALDVWKRTATGSDAASMAPWLIQRLQGEDAEPPADASPASVPPAAPAPPVMGSGNGTSSSAGAPINSALRPAPPRQLGIDWPIGLDTGWGVYGLNLALQLVQRGDPRPVLFAPPPATLPALARFRLRQALDDADRFTEDFVLTPSMHVPGTMLRALGNGIVGMRGGERLRADHDVGVIFFEDTALDADAIERARRLDLLIAGSTWNGDVLRSRGLTNVRVALQGIDPTVFHPAPRSGALDGRFVIFSGGKLEYRKGQDIAAAAFRVFRQRHPDALLMTAWHNAWPATIGDFSAAGHLAGAPRIIDGVLRVSEWLQGQGIPADAILDLGSLPNAVMGQVVREADVALFTNRAEGGTNLVAMECMAAGVPTIVSANTGHLDLVSTGGCFPLDHQTAVSAPATSAYRGTEGWGESDVNEIVALLEQLYTDRDCVRRRGALGAEAMQGMTWARQVEKLITELGDVL